MDSDEGSDAQIRLLNVSNGYDSLDLYVNNENEDDSDQLTLNAVSYGTLSDYSKVESGTYSIKLNRNGVTATLLTLSEERLGDDTHATYVAYGSTGQLAALEILENQGAPAADTAVVRVFNVAKTGTLDVFLTDESVSLADSAPVASVDNGAGADVTVNSGSYRLRVTGNDDTSDLRLDLSSVAFESRQIVALILTESKGGVLVNAVLLPQQGAVTSRANTKARVRGAVALASSSAVTAGIGGVNLLTGATAGVIGSRYKEVEAGSAAVTVTVGGTPVAAASQTLTAGADYTLLVWDDASGTQTTLISDDNRLPTTSGKAKVRLLNGMSGLGEPITLAIDFSPLGEGVALGQVSSPTEVDSGSDYELTVTNSNTTASLLSRTEVSLQDLAVYTMFMTGSGSAASGTLRKDR